MIRPAEVADPDGRPSVAVVGSGLAGLAAAWLLRERARVTVYEAHERPGMGVHSVRVGANGAGPLIDVPLRVFTPAYYPTLLALYAAAGVEVAPVDYAASFSELGGDTYFRYRNARVAGRSLPWLPPGDLVRPATRAIARDLLRLHRVGPGHIADGRARGRTLGEYLAAEGYSDAFVDGFVLPTYATVCTCTLESARRYPAEVVLRYLCSGVTTQGVMRAVGGSEDVATRLLEGAASVRTSTPVAGLAPRADGVTVTDASGSEARYDHVVLATRADQGAALVRGDPALTGLLERIPHEPSRVVVHHDARLAPRDRGAWRPVNILRSEHHAAPMATIWLNRVQPGLDETRPLFQTWNPLLEPAPDQVVADARVARPLVTVGTREVPASLAALHDQADRRIWPVGSYAEAGIPLLEAAAASAFRVARVLGADVPAVADALP
ncbi:MAG: FAD-dependent oxidoreductase [Longimicrobiales bacterium]